MATTKELAMLTRRSCLVSGSAAAGAAMAGLGCTPTAADRIWTPIRSGDSVPLNGIRYEAECGSNREAMQISKGQVVRFSMIPGNHWENDDRSDSERTELDGWRTQLSGDRVIWSSWSMFYEPGDWSTSDWCILRQIYHVKGYPMTHLLKPGGQLLWVGAAGSDKPDDDRIRYRQKIDQGAWLHFVESYKFDPINGAGHWKSWLNGRQVVDYQGALGFKTSPARYVKFGVYRGIRMRRDGELEDLPRGRVKEKITMRYANLRFGYDDLSQLIPKPEPVPAWEPWTGAAG